MKTVIFDNDGLMFDTGSIFAKVWDYAGEKIGIGKAGYMAMKTLGMSITMSRDIWISEFGEKYNEQDFRKYVKIFLTEYYKINKAPVKKGLYGLLYYLKSNNYKLAVVSSSPRWEVEKHLKDAKVKEYFEVIVCGEMVNKTKPDPDIYLKACELLGQQPKNCYALEDSKNGLLSAHRAGCNPIMVPDLWQPDEVTEKILHAKFVDLEEVKDFFEKQKKWI